MAADREFEVVVFGATGFTGRLVVEYYLQQYGPPPTKLKWAVAGRSKSKLEKVLSDLEQAGKSGATKVPVVVCDSNDNAALAQMVTRTKVVVTTVGPYTTYGVKLVAACAAHGTHYADLTGEPPFVKDSVAAFEAQAKTTGAKIVHCCGFDSEPSDLGSFLVYQEMKKRGIVPREIKFVVGPFSGGASGGTIHSAAAVVDIMVKQGRLSELSRPQLFVSQGSKSSVRVREHFFLGWDWDVRRWTIPFIMAGVNSRIVVRSGALLGYDAFTYSETMSFPGTLMGFVTSVAAMAALSTFLVLFILPPTRWLILKYLPAGSGPSEEVRKKGYGIIYLVGRGDKDGKEVVVRATVNIAGDPGYQETAKMIGESGVCLAKDGLKAGGGVLTPAAAMGSQLIERLKAVNLRITIDEEDKKK